MSVVVKFSDADGGPSPSVTIPYAYGDHVLLALKLTCGAMARKKGERYVAVLEKIRLEELRWTNE